MTDVHEKSVTDFKEKGLPPNTFCCRAYDNAGRRGKSAGYTDKVIGKFKKIFSFYLLISKDMRKGGRSGTVKPMRSIDNTLVLQ